MYSVHCNVLITTQSSDIITSFLIKRSLVVLKAKFYKKVSLAWSGEKFLLLVYPI